MLVSGAMISAAIGLVAEGNTAKAADMLDQLRIELYPPTIMLEP